MKKLILLLFPFLFIYAAIAQESQINNKVNLGIQLNQYQNDFGSGITVTTPYFANRRLALRLRINAMFHEHIKNEETTWSPYLNSTLGVTGITGTVEDNIRLYGEGGIIGLFPSGEFSSSFFELGGYGLFGFEFFMSPASNYFIEIGAVGTGAKADKLPNNPIYSNGMLISTGFRFQLSGSGNNDTNNTLASKNIGNMSTSNESKKNQYESVIYGMGGGVLLGAVMGLLMDDPSLGMALGITIGSGAWYTYQHKTDD